MEASACFSEMVLFTMEEYIGFPALFLCAEYNSAFVF